MANIYIYAGTKHGASPDQYCDYANISVDEIAGSGGLASSYAAGGAIPSSKNTGDRPDTGNNNNIFPLRNYSFENNDGVDIYSNRRNKPIPSSKNTGNTPSTGDPTIMSLRDRQRGGKIRRTRPVPKKRGKK